MTPNEIEQTFEERQTQHEVNHAIRIYNAAYQAGYDKATNEANAEKDRFAVELLTWMGERKLLDELLMATSYPEEIINEFKNTKK